MPLIQDYADLLRQQELQLRAEVERLRTLCARAAGSLHGFAMDSANPHPATQALIDDLYQAARLPGWESVSP